MCSAIPTIYEMMIFQDHWRFDLAHRTERYFLQTHQNATKLSQRQENKPFRVNNADLSHVQQLQNAIMFMHTMKNLNKLSHVYPPKWGQPLKEIIGPLWEKFPLINDENYIFLTANIFFFLACVMCIINERYAYNNVSSPVSPISDNIPSLFIPVSAKLFWYK